YVPHDHHHRGRHWVTRVTNPKQRWSATCPMYGGYLCGSHLLVPTDLMDRIDTRDFKYIPTTRSLPVLKSGDRGGHGTCSAC
ncbi:hypothetical protein TNCV_2618741, partial [Trichonephila clavipes]